MLLFILIACSGCVNAQEKHDNEILISGATLKQTINAFMDAGFRIDKYDTTMGFVYIAPKDEGAATIFYQARLKDSSIIITGNLRIVVLSSSLVPIECRGMSRSVMRLAWNEMDKISKSIGLPVFYAKK